MRHKIGKSFVIIGIVMIVIALAIGAVSIFNGYQAGKKSDALGAQMMEQIGTLTPGEIPDYILNPDMDMPTVDIDGESCIGILEIPAIGKKLPVIDEWSYEKLRVAPCRYAGTAYKKDMILAAHNWQAHFGLLTDLDFGDKVIFADAAGNVFNYEVVDIEILQPTAVKEMKSGEWDLTLFTCDYSITKRIAVRCMQIK
ncbi:MAG: sortase [Firmicutes bacterium]|nr:sortase [Bacillota bacterium]